MPSWLWVQWALIVEAADANVLSWFKTKAYRDYQFQQVMSGGR